MEPYQAAATEPDLSFNQQTQALHVPNMSLVAEDRNGIAREEPEQQLTGGSQDDGDSPPPSSEMPHHLGNESGRTPRPGHSLYCQVEDCGAPLTGLKEYHQRYKVCETHLKINYIERDGHKLRFCQQCGRFQPLDEFDSNKRSCRARLQRHNARRRKRPRDSTGAATGIGSPIIPGLTPSEVAAMQDAVQFASATLMHTTAHGGLAGNISGLDTSSANAAATIAGLPFGGGLSAMPFVPSKDVMLLLLKGYAGMFHYSLDRVGLSPLATPTPAHELSLPMEAAAAAAAAMAAVPDAADGGAGPDDSNAVAHLLAIQSQAQAQPMVQDTQHAQQVYTELPDVLPFVPGHPEVEQNAAAGDAPPGHQGEGGGDGDVGARIPEPPQAQEGAGDG